VRKRYINILRCHALVMIVNEMYPGNGREAAGNESLNILVEDAGLADPNPHLFGPGGIV
jgi:hypothetical protein